MGFQVVYLVVVRTGHCTCLSGLWALIVVVTAVIGLLVEGMSVGLSMNDTPTVLRVGYELALGEVTSVDQSLVPQVLTRSRKSQERSVSI